ncbi:MAG: transketolase [Deltaproteobacteria bacterium]|nr:transketolase [Deltaproteobacteria bacterium]MBI3295794.1 transketolase [Deltaproteobacteria bacterium]
MILNEANIKVWSTIGSRATFGLAALELGKTIDDLLILTADTSTSAGLDRFKKAYPQKFLDVGISEQNMMGIAAGLASEGTTVFTATFAPFQTLRCCEQIKVNLGYMGHKVCFVGLASGLVLGVLGYTHCAIEDVAVMRALSGITILSPADCTETVKATLAAASHSESVYIRLTGGAKAPCVYKSDYDFQIGKAIRLKEGRDVAIVACGTMVYESLEAAKILEAQGISASVINMHTIKPLDTQMIETLCQATQLLVTVEEHSIVGGLGSAVAEFKTTLCSPPPQLILGAPNRYGKSGEYRRLLETHNLTAPQIADSIAKRLKQVAPSESFLRKNHEIPMAS